MIIFSFSTIHWNWNVPCCRDSQKRIAYVVRYFVNMPRDIPMGRYCPNGVSHRTHNGIIPSLLCQTNVLTSFNVGIIIMLCLLGLRICFWPGIFTVNIFSCYSLWRHVPLLTFHAMVCTKQLPISRQLDTKKHILMEFYSKFNKTK